MKEGRKKKRTLIWKKGIKKKKLKKNNRNGKWQKVEDEKQARIDNQRE